MNRDWQVILGVVIAILALERNALISNSVIQTFDNVYTSTVLIYIYKMDQQLTRECILTIYKIQFMSFCKTWKIYIDIIKEQL